jgi:hypothetical protein
LHKKKKNQICKYRPRSSSWWILTKIGWSLLKINISRTTRSEKLKFTGKLADIIQKQFLKKIMVPEGLMRVTIGETILACVYIGKIDFKSLLLKNN